MTTQGGPCLTAARISLISIDTSTQWVHINTNYPDEQNLQKEKRTLFNGILLMLECLPCVSHLSPPPLHQIQASGEVSSSWPLRSTAGPHTHMCTQTLHIQTPRTHMHTDTGSFEGNQTSILPYHSQAVLGRHRKPRLKEKGWRTQRG